MAPSLFHKSGVGMLHGLPGCDPQDSFMPLELEHPDGRFSQARPPRAFSGFWSWNASSTARDVTPRTPSCPWSWNIPMGGSQARPPRAFSGFCSTARDATPRTPSCPWSWNIPVGGSLRQDPLEPFQASGVTMLHQLRG
ncbi:uncharacterized protein BDV14DRAFT_180597, partial [Aspergillus stella-maris]|uniref:uncharacterized protein n=1 Tax=Aspergillus stella-maris TaxID=1810926 RepID=UPI003CCE3E58